MSGISPLGGTKISKSPVAGGGETELATFPQSMEYDGGFAIDSTNVYVAIDIDASAPFVPCKFEDLFRVDRATGEVTKLLTAGKLQSIALDSQHIYFSDFCAGTINRLPLDASPGTTPVTLATALNANFVSVDDTYVYWTTNAPNELTGSIERIEKAP